MTKDRYSIGEFSEVSGVSKRMLRHYDKLELFCPVEINEDNGYRYYRDEQLDELDKILFLQKLGFSLSHIKEILSNPIGIHEFTELLKDKEMHLTNQSDEIKSSLLATQRMINMLEKESPRMFPSIYKLLDFERSLTVDKKNVNLIDLKALMNRDMFMEKIEDIVAKDKGDVYHFLTFDIDNFMYVNDRDGYEVGDAVIAHVMSIIHESFLNVLNKDNSGLLARLGGDEIAIFLKNENHDEVLKYADHAIESVRAFEFKTIGCTEDVTISGGISYGKSPSHVLALKDYSVKALIEAKRSGRDQYILKAL
jgi:diguanylate cyclase (GGDEF)-like protein